MKQMNPEKSTEQTHVLSPLFKQLGLPADNESIDAFIQKNRPIPAHACLEDLPVWNGSQSQFLREERQLDANWSLMIDSLSALLQGKCEPSTRR